MDRKEFLKSSTLFGEAVVVVPKANGFVKN